MIMNAMMESEIFRFVANRESRCNVEEAIWLVDP